MIGETNTANFTEGVSLAGAFHVPVSVPRVHLFFAVDANSSSFPFAAYDHGDTEVILESSAYRRSSQLKTSIVSLQVMSSVYARSPVVSRSQLFS